MEPKTKIRCCPFCGGEGEIISDSDSGEMASFAVKCKQCHAMTAFYLNDKKRAVRAWNRAMGKDKRSDLAITKGHWMVTYDGLRCSICNYKLDTTAVPDICPCCGSETRDEV